MGSLVWHKKVPANDYNHAKTEMSELQIKRYYCFCFVSSFYASLL